MKEFWVRVLEQATAFGLRLIDQHPGKTAGVILGFVIGLFVVLLGFLKSLIIVLFVIVGYLIGKRRDENKGFSQLLEMFFGDRK